MLSPLRGGAVGVRGPNEDDKLNVEAEVGVGIEEGQAVVVCEKVN
jgi:hypothetical protein